MGDVTNNEVEMTLGKKLRQLTNKARSEAEINAFYKVLEENAKNGADRVQFDDLRMYLNNMIMAGTVWDWMRSQDLKFTGAVSQDTGKYSYVIYWE